VLDLYPESIVELGVLDRNNPIIKALRWYEKQMYIKADEHVFSQEGGRDYIIEQGWDKDHGGPIDLNTVHYINNGVDIDVYDKEIKGNPYYDADLDDADVFKVVYAGSIRPANDLQLLVDAAEKLKSKKVKVLIFGDGEDKKRLEQYCEEKSIDNVVFKGRVEKNCIPNILSKSDLNVLNYRRASTWKYGGSQIKLFEYFGSGKPVIANVDIKYSQIKSFSCGISKDIYTAEEYAENIEKIVCLEKEEYNEMCKNARLCAEEFDVHILAEKLIDVLEA
jgi:glycosyltransferase involved in cell wall biosynthesis